MASDVSSFPAMFIEGQFREIPGSITISPELFLFEPNTTTDGNHVYVMSLPMEGLKARVASMATRDVLHITTPTPVSQGFGSVLHFALAELDLCVGLIQKLQGEQPPSEHLLLLQSMFPQVSTARLQLVLDECGGDPEKAIDECLTLSSLGLTEAPPSLTRQAPVDPSYTETHTANPFLNPFTVKETVPVFSEEFAVDGLGSVAIQLATSSRILEDSTIPLLASMLPPRVLLRPLWLRTYSSTNDGVSLQTFYEKCRRAQPSLLLVKDTSRAVFGCFTTDAWSPKLGARHFYGSGQAFVFTLAPEPRVYRTTGLNTYYQLSSEKHLAVGGSASGASALFLEANFETGTTHFSETFANPPLTSSSEFDILEVEVWEFARS